MLMISTWNVNKTILREFFLNPSINKENQIDYLKDYQTHWTFYDYTVVVLINKLLNMVEKLILINKLMT